MHGDEAFPISSRIGAAGTRHFPKTELEPLPQAGLAMVGLGLCLTVPERSLTEVIKRWGASWPR